MAPHDKDVIFKRNKKQITVMKNELKVVALIATLITTVATLSAQPGPPGGYHNNGWGNGGGNNQGGGNGNGNFGGGNNGNGNGNGNPGVPLDGGVTMLLGAGGLVAYRKYKHKG